MKAMKFNPPARLVMAVALAAGLAACGGGGNTVTMTMTPEEECKADGGTWANDMCETAAMTAMKQVAAIRVKLMEAETAVAAVDVDSTDAEVKAAEDAVAAARQAIADAAAVSAEVRAGYTRTVDVHASRLAAARTARMTAMDDADRAARMAMMQTARKLYDGIKLGSSVPLLCFGSECDSTTYPDVGTDGLGALVNSGGRFTHSLSEDKQTMVAANHGWEGKRYTAAPEGGDTYEAVLYSNVEDPTEGEKFSTQYSANFAGGTLDEATTEGDAGRVASPSFDHTAGLKRFTLPENRIAVMIAGSYHGVPGTYSCAPGTGNTCAASFAGPGFALGGVTADGAFAAANAEWTFRPADPDARVMSAPDTTYASYGWWLHKTADDTYSAYALHQETLPTAGTITALRGTATYRGGAAGLYALSSLTGGTNDAGSFTATATLEADFHTDMISGVINDFTGADGRARNWSVELKESDINNAGLIQIPRAGGSTDFAQTVWTIDGTATAAAGLWNGRLLDSGDDGVPKVVSGMFRSTYGNGGRMTGAFGANLQ